MIIKCTTNQFNWAGFYSGKEYEIIKFKYYEKDTTIFKYQFGVIGDNDNVERAFYKHNLIEHFGMTEESVINLINKLLVFQ